MVSVHRVYTQGKPDVSKESQTAYFHGTIVGEHAILKLAQQTGEVDLLFETEISRMKIHYQRWSGILVLCEDVCRTISH